MKKIVHIGFGGGVTNVMQTMAAGLPGYSHALIAFGPGINPNHPGLWSPAYNPFKIWQSLWSVYNTLRRDTPDIVVLHGFIPTVLAVWPTRWAGVRHIIGIDHGPQPTYTTVKAMLYFFAFPQLERLVSVSRDAFAWQIEHFPFVQKKKMMVIENGIFMPATPQIRTISTTPPFLLTTMARLDFPQKDPLTLIKAAALLRDQGLSFRFDIFGNGNAFTECQNLVERLSLQSYVSLQGQNDNARQHLPEYDLVILSTHWEGLPLGLLEAMANGIPVVASNVVGVKSLLNDGQLGYLFDESSAVDLATKITLALQQPERSQLMARAAQKHVHDHYTLNKMLSQYAQLFNEVQQKR